MVVTVFVLLGLKAFDNRLSVTLYTIESEKIRLSVRFALLTDLHSCKYGENQSELVDAVRDADPDFILMAGDIMDDVLPPDNTLIFLEAVADEYDCYYVTGNHEIWSGEAEHIKQVFCDYGVTVFEGDSVVFERDRQRISLCGVDDPEAGAFDEQLKTAFETADKSNYLILLSHRPEIFDDYAGYAFDLIVSGHAHGGQWRIPFLLDGVIAPNQGFFPAYTGGIYYQNDSQMLVSRGLARETTRVPRVFNPPELVIVDLVPPE